jgi:hypothetical protein
MQAFWAAIPSACPVLMLEASECSSGALGPKGLRQQMIDATVGTLTKRSQANAHGDVAILGLCAVGAK